jgi:hypothetical protein
MEKKIAQWAFTAGLVCAGIAVVWRGANFLGFYVSSVVPGITVYYMSFFKGAFLLLMVSIAAAQAAAVREMK